GLGHHHSLGAQDQPPPDRRGGLADLRRRRGDRGRRPGALLRRPRRAHPAPGRRRGADALQPEPGEGRHPLGRRHRAPGAQDDWPQRARSRLGMSDVKMPKLSDTMEEGTVLEWKKQDGDEVKRGEVLAEIESDKASFEIEAESDGEKASPLARRLARERGVDLASIKGSGPGGRIVKEDVLAAGEQPAAAEKPKPAPAARRPEQDVEIEEPTRMQATIARRMTQ